MSPDAAQIAEAVARALKLGEPCWNGWEERCWFDGKEFLLQDGSDVFRGHWFKRCVLWLLEQRYEIVMDPEFERYVITGDDNNLAADGLPWQFEFRGIAEEFPARAIFALMEGKP